MLRVSKRQRPTDPRRASPCPTGDFPKAGGNNLRKSQKKTGIAMSLAFPHRLGGRNSAVVRLHLRYTREFARTARKSHMGRLYWYSPSQTAQRPLDIFAREGERKTLDLLEKALLPSGEHAIPREQAQCFQAPAPQDVSELLPHLQERGERLAAEAEGLLTTRGDKEAGDMRGILERQRKAIVATKEKTRDIQPSLFEEERRQMEFNRRLWHLSGGHESRRGCGTRTLLSRSSVGEAFFRRKPPQPHGKGVCGERMPDKQTVTIAPPSWRPITSWSSCPQTSPRSLAHHGHPFQRHHAPCRDVDGRSGSQAEGRTRRCI